MRSSTGAVGPGLITVAATDLMWTDAAQSLVSTSLAAPQGSRIFWCRQGTTIAEKRNAAVVNLLALPGLEWLFFNDSDMIVPPGAIERLASHGLEIVSGLYVERNRTLNGAQFVSAGHIEGPQWRPLSAAHCDGSVRRVDVVGAGCLLVRRSVFERMGTDGPWFTSDRQGINEDWSFCIDAAAAGAAVHVDTSVIAGHLTGHALMPSLGPVARAYV